MIPRRRSNDYLAGRRRNRRDPVAGLLHVKLPAGGGHRPFFDTITQPAAVSLDLAQMGDGPIGGGVLFEFGGGAHGFAAWVEPDGTLGVAAGPSAAGGLTLTVPDFLSVVPSLGGNATGPQQTLAVAVEPSAFKVVVWLNGNRVATATGAGPWPSGFAGNAEGVFGAVGTVAGTVTNRVPAASRIALDGVAVRLARVAPGSLPPDFAAA